MKLIWQLSQQKENEEGSYLPSNRNSPKSELKEKAHLAILISTTERKYIYFK